MYIMPDRPIDSHRIVAQNLLLCNPLITKRDALMENVAILNNLTKEDIEKLTIEGAIDLGITLAFNG
jgi:hypothetical protein